MKKGIFVAVMAFALQSFAATQYDVDAGHTSVGFGVTHMMISTVKGRFNKFDGKFNFDDAKGDLSDIDVKIDVASIDTNEKKRDEHLLSPEFFDVKTFPTITFKSEKIEKVHGKPAKIVGNLSIHGKSQKVTLTLDYKGPVTDPWGNSRFGFTASGKVNRKDFGLNWNKNLDKGGVAVGDEVTLTIEGEAVKSAAKAAKN
jgi:polyisoprenoid-binding protein YceI